MGRKTGTQMTIEQRIKLRDGHLRARNKSCQSPSEMLDLFLLGERAVDIAEAYSITVDAFYSSVSKEALYRLIGQAGAEHMNEVIDTETIHV